MAKKYIDAERLRAKIEKYLTYDNSIDTAFYIGRRDAERSVLALIDSLQQEQPEPTCKSCGFYENNCPFIRNTFKPYPNKICKDYTYSVMKEQEQPEVDLEKEIDKEWKNCCPIDEGMGDESALLVIEQFHQIARHFYELGLKAKEESK